MNEAGAPAHLPANAHSKARHRPCLRLDFGSLTQRLLLTTQPAFLSR